MDEILKDVGEFLSEAEDDPDLDGLSSLEDHDVNTVQNVPLEVSIQLDPLSMNSEPADTAESVCVDDRAQQSTTDSEADTKTGKCQDFSTTPSCSTFSVQVGLSFGDFILRYISRHNPDKPAITLHQSDLAETEATTSLTYGQLLEQLVECRGWVERCRSPRDNPVVAVMCANTPEACVTMLGSMSAGAVVTPCNPLHTIDELRFQLMDSGAIIMVTEGRFLAKTIRAARGTNLAQVVLCGELDLSVTKVLKQSEDGSRYQLRCGPEHTLVVTRYSTVVRTGADCVAGTPPGEATPDDWRSVPIEADCVAGIPPDEATPDDWRSVPVDPSKRVALLPYSVPLRGSPNAQLRGVPLTHAHLVAQLLQISHVSPLFDQAEHRVLLTIPLFQPVGLLSLLVHTLCRGESTILLPSWSAKAVCTAVDQHRVTVLPLLQCTAQSFLEFEGSRHVSSASQHAFASVQTLWLWCSPPVSPALEQRLVSVLTRHWQSGQGAEGEERPRVEVVRAMGCPETSGLSHLARANYTRQPRSGKIVRVGSKGKTLNHAMVHGYKSTSPAGARSFARYFVEIGEPLPGTEVRMKRLPEEVVGRHFYDQGGWETDLHIGELQLTGPHIASGYWKTAQDGTTTEPFHGVWDSDGYLSTGWVVLEVRGVHWLLTGFNLNSQQPINGFVVDCQRVESVIRSFEGVEDCAVFFVNSLETSNDEVFSPIVKSVIEHKDVHEDTPDALLQAICHKLEDHLKATIAPHNLPIDDNANALVGKKNRTPRLCHHGLHFVSSLSSLFEVAKMESSPKSVDATRTWYDHLNRRAVCASKLGRMPSVVKLLRLGVKVGSKALQLMNGSESLSSTHSSPKPESTKTTEDKQELQSKAAIVSSLRGQLSATTEKNKQNQEEIETLKMRLKKVEADDKKQQIDWNRRQDAFKLRLRRLEADSAQDKKDAERSQYELQCKVQTLGEEIEQMAKTGSLLKAELVQSKASSQQLKQDNNQLREGNRTLQQQIDHLTNKCKTMERSKEKVERKMAKAMSESKSLSELLCTERTLHSAAVKDLAIARPKMERMKKRLEQLERSLLSVQARESNMVAQFKHDREAVRLSSRSNEQLRNKNMVLHKRIINMERQIEDLQAIRALEFESNAERITSILKQEPEAPEGKSNILPCEEDQNNELLELLQDSKAEYKALLEAHEAVQTECSRLSKEAAEVKVLRQKCNVLEIENALAVAQLAHNLDGTAQQDGGKRASFLEELEDDATHSVRTSSPETVGEFHSILTTDSLRSPASSSSTESRVLSPLKLQQARALMDEYDMASPAIGPVQLALDEVDVRAEVVQRYVMDLHMLFSLGGIRFPLEEAEASRPGEVNVYRVRVANDSGDGERTCRLMIGVAQEQLVASVLRSESQPEDLLFSDLLDVLANWCVRE